LARGEVDHGGRAEELPALQEVGDVIDVPQARYRDRAVPAA
jgi:hypothetical protein